tara:strand:+ start:1606 stop:1818 length:213 start_codon:yes stop_codon:yes gene_type:complete
MTDEVEKKSLWRKRAVHENMKEKTELGKSITLRLTQSEYAEYVRLGGIKWMRMLLQLSAGIQKEIKETKK